MNHTSEYWTKEHQENSEPDFHGKWINVHDAMPEKHEAVLIAKGENIGHARRRVTSWCVIASNDIVTWDQVTHWMRLPEPPTT